MTKRFAAVIVIMALIMTMFILPDTACAIYDAYSCCSNGKPLIVREGPGKQYRQIGSLAYGERTAVDKCGNAFEGLYEVRAHCILKACCKSAGSAEFASCYEVAVEIVSYGDPVESCLKIIHVLCKAEDCHDL